MAEATLPSCTSASAGSPRRSNALPPSAARILMAPPSSGEPSGCCRYGGSLSSAGRRCPPQGFRPGVDVVHEVAQFTLHGNHAVDAFDLAHDIGDERATVDLAGQGHRAVVHRGTHLPRLDA